MDPKDLIFIFGINFSTIRKLLNSCLFSVLSINISHLIHYIKNFELLIEEFQFSLIFMFACHSCLSLPCLLWIHWYSPK